MFLFFKGHSAKLCCAYQICKIKKIVIAYRCAMTIFIFSKINYETY
ncbi:hypothetical protein ELI_2193 [Eubacterium callanderi]|uniref:Uncharacterized protein n=1 Tax=Eubacterium callanderi TaxID=53442 RepID=E3GNJ1_9FIRM|nr:hypothetical protein ELI_2193 [Eubacterium callanderi]